ncbi:hypothetical protein [Salicibibacter kimchii]|uniref:Uncharacterized protein n=1 Tax=Salicibibacter kimchii TaxID=2099786 RepID=A0A345BYC7_9BACI|nr:hypothetical protein [Salicibibacter kimchii]AXF55958.1 hypothetical protein DT065_07915 [Salicibibacter kimchii]
MTYQLIFHDHIKRFENTLLEKAEQEKRTKGMGPWLALADLYIIQKKRIRLYPTPEEFNDHTSGEEMLPIVKHVERNTKITNLFRRGLPNRSIGNFRLLYTLHNYHKVIFLHYFDTQYNGDIKRKDIKPAETRYFNYCIDDPTLYPIRKGE